LSNDEALFSLLFVAALLNFVVDDEEVNARRQKGKEDLVAEHVVVVVVVVVVVAAFLITMRIISRAREGCRRRRICLSLSLSLSLSLPRVCKKSVLKRYDRVSGASLLVRAQLPSLLLFSASRCIVVARFSSVL
jgi:hypothetical protein